MPRKLSKDIIDLTKSGVAVGVGGVIGQTGPFVGVPGAALRHSSTAFSQWFGPMATVSGAGAVVRSMKMLPRSRDF